MNGLWNFSDITQRNENIRMQVLFIDYFLLGKAVELQVENPDKRNLLHI
jgi:hypothetical protein